MQPIKTPVNPKDLRISNWVNLYGKPKQILPNDLVYLSDESADFKDAYEYIPITLEIFNKRNGFDKDYEGKAIYGYKTELNKDFIVMIARINNAVRFIFKGISFDIDHVHELQNTFRWLSGTELNINL
jgi:hypothetical protein